MNFQALKVFCEVVRLQSFSRGGEACGISQSAASQLIRNLETELGVRLIERAVRPPRPTEEGKAYYRGAQEILHRHRLVLDEIRRVREQVAGDFRVASIYSVGLHTVRPQIERFLRDNPGTAIRLEYHHPDQVYEAVLNDEAEIGITSYPKSKRGITVIPWLEEEMVVVAGPAHPLARRTRGKDGPTLRPSDLKGSSFVGFVTDLPIRREIDRGLRRHGIHVELVSEFDNIDTIKQAVELSEAISILPRPSIALEVGRGSLVVLPVEIALRRPVGIIRKKRKRLTHTAARFVENLLRGGKIGAAASPA